MTDSDDMKRRARELCEANSENRGDPCSTEHEILPALLARIEALEAERDEAKANQAGEHVLKMRADLTDLRADLARVTAERDALMREADRLRHDKWVEGDLVCYHEIGTLRAERDALRAQLEAATAERDAFHRDREEWARRCDAAQAEMRRADCERDALRALLPTEVEREALAWLVAYSGSDTYLKTMRTALAALDRLLGGGR